MSPSQRGIRMGWLAMVGIAAGGLLTPPARAGSVPLRFNHLSVDDGLSQSSVEHILQDRQGFMWFGTQEGLNRYDGYRFTVHRAQARPGFLGDHSITALVEGRNGDLWVGTSRGLYRYELATGRFDQDTPAAANLGILDVVEVGPGEIVFAASDGGMWVLDHGGPQGSARLRREDVAAGVAITTLSRGRGDKIWAAGGGRLFAVDLGRTGEPLRAATVLNDLGSVSALAGDPAGDLWIGRHSRALLRYHPADGHVDRFPEAPRDVLALLPASDGTLWIGARGGGLARLDPTSGEVDVHRHDPEDPASLSRDDVAALYLDRVGSLWVGTWNGGVDQLDPYAQAFHTLRRRPHVPGSLPLDDVTALTEAPDGRLWLGSRSGGLAVGDPRLDRFQVAGPLADHGRVTALGPFGSRLLVGTARGLAIVDRGTAHEVPLLPPWRSCGLEASPVTAIRTAPESAWIASGRTVVRAVEGPSSETSVRCHETPLSTPVSTLSAPVAGRVWVGSEAGELALAEWDQDGTDPRFRRLDFGDGALVAHGLITALHEDPLGHLWVGTRRGLARIEPTAGTIRWFGDRDGLPSTNVAGIAGDASGFVWVATNRGLTRIDSRTCAMIQFGEREGAQGTGYAAAGWASGASGLLYFAGNGVTVFDPREVRLSPDRPKIVFTGLEILRRPVPPKWLDPDSPLERAVGSVDEVTLGPSATVFSVEMAALQYSDPQGNRLSYRLEGFDPDWIETDAQSRVATYTRLPPGRYVLHARARTRNGLWSEGEATLGIRILPPWWRTRIAIVGWSLLALALVGLAGAGVRHRTRVKLALLERETLRRESLTDPLTGLHNRRFLASYLEHEVPKLLREYETVGPTAGDSGADLLLLLVDVDHFKSINDRHSHAVGDQVLTRIARVLKEHIRDSDLAVRWGGDEFLVVSRSFHREFAKGSVERLCRTVEELGQDLAREGGPACTLSIGYAPFPFLVGEPKALSWEQTLELADHALRLTKTRQRNSHTGLRAGPGLPSREVLAFLSSRGALPLPPAVEVLIP